LWPGVFRACHDGGVTISRRRVLIAVTVAWIVLLAALAVQAARHDPPTVRGQTTIDQALPTVDRAVADLTVAAEASDVVVEITGYRRVSGKCTITTARPGTRYERAVYLYVSAGQEPNLIDRIRTGLPRRYDTTVTRTARRELTADAGDFVAVRGGIVGPGQVRISADTGCRPGGGPGRGPHPAVDQRPVDAALAVLHVPAADRRTASIGCPRGGAITTDEADGPTGSAPASLPDALTGGTPEPVVAQPTLYAYRSGPVGVVVRTHDGIVTVTATAGCTG
jgi:hypothetical protein